MSVGSSVNFPCVRCTFRELQSTFHVSAGLSVNFGQLPCDHGNMCQISPTFHASVGHSFSFFQLSMLLRDLPSNSSTFRMFSRPSFNFHQRQCIYGTSCHLPSIFLASAGTSVNFLYVHWTLPLISVRSYVHQSMFV